jgi:S1/P1 Nuclease
MNVKYLKCIVFTWLLAISTTFNVNAWDGTGHMLVAQIAYERLNPKARVRVDELASQLDRTGTPYNAVSLACWPDDIKDKNSKSPFQGKFRPWHYIDIGCSTNDPDVFAHAAALSQTNGDVVAALNLCVGVIKNKKTNELVPSQAVALALVMHFVGDIHQPLHTTARYNPNPKPGDKYKDDAGGNGVSVANLVDTPWSKNLHTFWDEAYRRFYQDGEVKAMPELAEVDVMTNPATKEWMKRLEADAPSNPNLQFDAKGWALESHAIACTMVYGTLGEPYGARNIKLQEKYVNEAVQIARHRIVLAGYRLAALLNELYGQ